MDGGKGCHPGTIHPWQGVATLLGFDHAWANSMTTLMSSERRCSAFMNASGLLLSPRVPLG